MNWRDEEFLEKVERELLQKYECNTLDEVLEKQRKIYREMKEQTV